MKKTILVIEDEQDMRDLLVDALTEGGYKVFTAEDGKDGLEQFDRTNPDLVLLDLMLPQIGGQDVLKTIRETEGSRAKIIILSAMQDVTNVGQAYESGISDYIIKSETSPTEILRKVNALLG